MKVVVKNNTNSEHGYVVKTGDEREKVSFTIRPGWNEIDASLWSLAKNSGRKFASSESLIQFRLEEGVYEVKGEELPEASNPLEKLKVREAVKLVEETYVDELLESWSNLEKRKDVKAAIEAQLKKLALPNPEDIAKKPIKG